MSQVGALLLSSSIMYLNKSSYHKITTPPGDVKTGSRKKNFAFVQGLDNYSFYYKKETTDKLVSRRRKNNFRCSYRNYNTACMESITRNKLESFYLVAGSWLEGLLLEL